MILSILFIAVGVLVLAAGLYYFSKAGDDAEAKKIYGIIGGVGAVIAIVAAIRLLLPL